MEINHGGIKPRSAPDTSPVYLREMPIDAPRRWAVAVLWLLVGVLVALAVFTSWPASAMDHGFDKGDPFAQWVESLMRPPEYKYSCCGKGDLYGIRIEEDAIGDEGNDVGTAVITDGAEITYPDGTRRSPIPNGTVFHFKKSVVNDRQGNPTATAFAFLGVIGNDVGIVWCVIPLPGAV